MARFGRPTASDDHNEALRAVARAVIRADFAGTQARAAQAFGVEPPSLSNFLAGKSGAGHKMSLGIARYLRRSVDQIVAAGGDLEALRGGSEAMSAPRRVIFGELPNWRDMESRARAIHPDYPEWVWELLGRTPVTLDVPVTAAFVAAIAVVVRDFASPPSP